MNEELLNKTDTNNVDNLIQKNKQEHNLYKYYILTLILIILFISLIDFKKKNNNEIKNPENNSDSSDKLKEQNKYPLNLELKEEIINLIKEDLIKEIKGQLMVELKEKIKEDFLNLELKEEIINLIKEDLMKEMMEQVMVELKEKIKEELLLELKKEIIGLIKKDLVKEVKEQLTVELKEKIKEELKIELNLNKKEPSKEITPIQPQIKVGLCVIGKKENLYANEFIDYYKKLGYNHIFIYDNNDVNDERFENVLSKEISENFVSIINYRGYRGQKGNPQYLAYQDCYQKNSEEYDWLSFYDFDEFLVLKNYSNIQEFLSEKKFENCVNIKINWMLYSDNDLIYYDNRPVQERFTEPLPNDYSNKHIKSTVRGHLKTNYWKDLNNPHSSNANVNCCIPTGKKIDHKTPFNTPPNYEYAYIKHYVTKTIEEFILKVKRGIATKNVIINDEYWKEKLTYFFAKNKKTKEKLDYIKETLNNTFNITLD